MAAIYIGDAGGAPSNGFIRSLRESSRSDYMIGTSCIVSDLFLAEVEEKGVVPSALSRNYEKLVTKVKPDLHLFRMSCPPDSIDVSLTHVRKCYAWNTYMLI